MYAYLWRLLPGPLPTRIALATLAVAVVVWILMGLVFPGVEALLPSSDVTFSPRP